MSQRRSALFCATGAWGLRKQFFENSNFYVVTRISDSHTNSIVVGFDTDRDESGFAGFELLWEAKTVYDTDFSKAEDSLTWIQEKMTDIVNRRTFKGDCLLKELKNHDAQTFVLLTPLLQARATYVCCRLQRKRCNSLKYDFSAIQELNSNFIGIIWLLNDFYIHK